MTHALSQPPLGRPACTVADRPRLKAEQVRGKRRGAFFAALIFALGLASCVPERSNRGRGSTTGAEPTGGAAPALDLVGDATWPAPYASDPIWLRASTGDDLDHARLAHRESALTLSSAVIHGGSLGRTALLALPYASDRREARGPLCELVKGPSTATSSLLLSALHQLVIDGPRTEESVDVQADARCARILRELALDTTLSAGDRDRATGIIARLEAR